MIYIKPLFKGKKECKYVKVSPETFSGTPQELPNQRREIVSSDRDVLLFLFNSQALFY